LTAAIDLEARAVSSSRILRRLAARAGAALSFFGWLYLSISLFLFGWILGTQALMGWSPLLVASGSMSPAIRSGDIVMIGKELPATLGDRTVIVFDDPTRPGETLLHRVVGVDGDGRYETRGDANADSDLAPVAREHIGGVGRMVIPAVGSPIVWWQAGEVGKVVMFAVGSIAAVWCAFRRPRARNEALRS
jgi:signal peptidase I